MKISVQGDSLELPTESEAYTLGVKVEDGILVVNIVADTYFGARKALENTNFIFEVCPISNLGPWGPPGPCERRALFFESAIPSSAQSFLQTWSGDPVPACRLGS